MGIRWQTEIHVEGISSELLGYVFIALSILVLAYVISQKIKNIGVYINIYIFVNQKSIVDILLGIMVLSMKILEFLFKFLE